MLFYSLLFSLFFSSLPQVLPTSDDPAVLYLSQDQGTSWENFDAGLPEDLQLRNLVEAQWASLPELL